MTVPKNPMFGIQPKPSCPNNQNKPNPQTYIKSNEERRKDKLKETKEQTKKEKRRRTTSGGHRIAGVLPMVA